MKKKEYLTYLLTFQGINYYLDLKTNKIYANIHRQQFHLDLTKYVPAASILLLHGFTSVSNSQLSFLWKLILLVLGYVFVGYLVELLARTKKETSFNEFHFETLPIKDEFLYIFSRNVYGKFGIGIIFAFFAIYQSVEYLSKGSYLSYLLSDMGFFISYFGLISSHLFKQIIVLKKLKKKNA
ncbi:MULTISPECIES: hypothetical protein [Streptococcus]|uniref:hypothetical protein n=1 Tax=Streptococcus TaxID=1301 RepID=UPI002283F4A9|nr:MULTISPECIES: hypothetical protein [Streptococcus]MCY7024343.1 hypothetical protein [Streptococcus sanguinis]MDQ8693240.1 hypothetical protein [Streptococcus sp. IsoGale022]